MRTPPNAVLSLPSLQGSEQLGEYNHRGKATGQADKRRPRAGLEWRGCRSVSPFGFLLKQQSAEGQWGPGTAGSQVSQW